MQIVRNGSTNAASAQTNNQLAKQAEQKQPTAQTGNKADVSTFTSPNAERPGYVHISGTVIKGNVVPCPEGSTELPPAEQWCEESTMQGDVQGDVLFVTTKNYEPDGSAYQGNNFIENGADTMTTVEKGGWDPNLGDVASLMWVTGGTGKWAGKTGIIHFNGKSTAKDHSDPGQYTYEGELWDIVPAPASKAASESAAK